MNQTCGSLSPQVEGWAARMDDLDNRILRCLRAARGTYVAKDYLAYVVWGRCRSNPLPRNSISSAIAKTRRRTGVPIEHGIHGFYRLRAVVIAFPVSARDQSDVSSLAA